MKLLLLLLAPSLAAAQANDAVLFPEEAEISVVESGMQRLELDADILGQCQPDLSDLRVHDADGHEVAWLVDGGGWRVDRRIVPEVLHRDRHNEYRSGQRRWTENLRVQAPADGAKGAWRLYLQATRRDFVRQIVVKQDGRVLAGPQSVWRLDDGRQRLWIDLPTLSPSPLEVELTGIGAGWMDASIVLESGSGGPSKRLELPLQPTLRREGQGRTELLFQRPRGIVPDALRIRTAGLAFDRDVRVWDEGPGQHENTVAQGRIHRLPGDPPLEYMLVPFDRVPRGTGLRVIIENGSSPPLPELSAAALLDAPALVFELPARSGPDGVLRFGGGRARAPDYDLDHLLLRAGPDRVKERLRQPGAAGTATLGPVRPNPAFADEPRLRFAARAGASVDPRAWSHERALQIDAADEAVHRVRLGPADLGRLRPDRGDLRVVDDEGQQWPYLSEELRNPVAAALERGARQDLDGRSSWVLTLPGGEALVETLELHFPEPFFDRAWSVETLEEPSITVASGRLLRRGDPRPPQLDLRGVRAATLRLVVENGDDAPLILEDARAWLPAWELFVTAPPGRYRVLLGNPMAEPPSYELAAVRGLVLATRAPGVEPGPLEPNEGHIARLHAPGGGREQVLVWVVLLLAVGVLGGLTLAAARPRSSEGG